MTFRVEDCVGAVSDTAMFYFAFTFRPAYSFGAVSWQAGSNSSYEFALHRMSHRSEHAFSLTREMSEVCHVRPSFEAGELKNDVELVANKLSRGVASQFKLRCHGVNAK